jgi:hypothetical protein
MAERGDARMGKVGLAGSDEIIQCILLLHTATYALEGRYGERADFERILNAKN